MKRGPWGGWLRVLASSETLDELPAAPSDRSRPSLLAWIFTSEPLPSDPPAAGKPRPSLFSLLLASESLPEDQVPGPRAGRRSFLEVLFSPESLPADPVAGNGQEKNRWTRR